ncbi:MAG: ArnT family glycosyltransferase, partial [Mangrovibacterium sp.]
MIRKISQYPFLPLVFFLFSLLLYASNIGGPSIYILDEAKNAECAREMFVKGDPVIPTFNEVLRTDKPPLHYFFMMGAYTLFGVNPFAARFFSALFGALTILLSYLFVRRYAGKEQALLTALVLLASVHLSIQFHLAVPDPYLIFFLSAALMSFYAAVQEKKRIFIWGIYLAVGLGTLTKGPVAIGLPGLAFLLFLLFSRRFHWQEIRMLHPFSGALLVLLIVLPWYILVHLKTAGAWTEGFFLEHNLERFARGKEGHGGTFLITFVYVMTGMFPFSAFLPQALNRASCKRKDELVLFCLVSALTIILFFALSHTRLPNYTVPAYPFLAILLAGYLQNNNGRMKLKASMILLLLFGLILVPVVTAGLYLDPALRKISYAGLYFLPLPLLLFLAFLQWQKGKTETALLWIAGSGTATALIFFLLAFPTVDQQNPVVKSTPLVRNREVRYYGKFNPAYSFLLQKEIFPVKREELESFFRRHPEGIIISTRKYTDQLQLPDELEISFSARDILERPTTVLI